MSYQRNNCKAITSQSSRDKGRISEYGKCSGISSLSVSYCLGWRLFYSFQKIFLSETEYIQ